MVPETVPSHRGTKHLTSYARHLSMKPDSIPAASFGRTECREHAPVRRHVNRHRPRVAHQGMTLGLKGIPFTCAKSRRSFLVLSTRLPLPRCRTIGALVLN